MNIFNKKNGLSALLLVCALCMQGTLLCGNKNKRVAINKIEAIEIDTATDIISSIIMHDNHKNDTFLAEKTDILTRSKQGQQELTKIVQKKVPSHHYAIILKSVISSRELNNLTFFRSLLECGQHNKIDPRTYKDLLMHVVQALEVCKKEDVMHTIKLLLKHGAKLNVQLITEVRNKPQQTSLLSLCIEHGKNPDMVQFLVDHDYFITYMDIETMQNRCNDLEMTYNNAIKSAITTFDAIECAYVLQQYKKILAFIKDEYKKKPFLTFNTLHDCNIVCKKN